MNFVLHQGVKTDLLEAVRYYAEIDIELAESFENHFDSCIKKIIKSPTRYRIIRNGLRKCAMMRFPYAVYYRYKDEAIQVVLVKHHRRHPNFGFDRK